MWLGCALYMLKDKESVFRFEWEALVNLENSQLLPIVSTLPVILWISVQLLFYTIMMAYIMLYHT